MTIFSLNQGGSLLWHFILQSACTASFLWSHQYHLRFTTRISAKLNASKCRICGPFSPLVKIHPLRYTMLFTPLQHPSFIVDPKEHDWMCWPRIESPVQRWILSVTLRKFMVMTVVWWAPVRKFIVTVQAIFKTPPSHGNNDLGQASKIALNTHTLIISSNRIAKTKLCRKKKKIETWITLIF